MLLRITPEAETVSHSVDGVRTKIPRMAWLLGAMALAFGLSEGTAVDWSALHVTDVAQVDSTTGALGLIAVSGFMVVIRLLGDRLVARFGRRNVVRFGGVCAALGYATVALVDSLPLLVAGWALVGFGVGMIAPQVYAVAGHLGGGRVLAVVVTFGYAAFLLGPAVVGALVSNLGIQHAMFVPALLCAGHRRPGPHHAEERRRSRVGPALRSLTQDSRTDHHAESRRARRHPSRNPSNGTRSTVSSGLAAGATRAGRRPDAGAVPDHPPGLASRP